MVADYAIATTGHGDADSIVFTNGSDKQVDLEYHAFSHTWESGQTDDFVYVLAREFDTNSETGIPDLYTSVLAQLTPSGVSHIDQINDSTYEIAITSVYAVVLILEKNQKDAQVKGIRSGLLAPFLVFAHHSFADELSLNPIKWLLRLNPPELWQLQTKQESTKTFSYRHHRAGPRRAIPRID